MSNVINNVSVSNTNNQENTMELIIPKSLIIAMSKESLVEWNTDDIKNNLVKVIQMVSKYESQHNYVPKEWSMFLDNLTQVLSTCTVKQQEMNMANMVELEAKRLEWITKLIFEGESSAELNSMSMVELRDRYEETFPSYLEVHSGTATGKSRSVVKINKPA